MPVITEMKKTFVIVFLLAFCLLLLNACGEQQAAQAEVVTPTAALSYPYEALSVSEIMVRNSSTLLRDGRFPDWVELHNGSSVSIPLDDVVISDGNKRHSFSGLTLAPGAYLLLICEEDLPFSLSDSETLTLTAPDGRVLSRYDCSLSEENASLICEDEGCRVSSFPTPGYPNTAEGYEACQSALQSGPALRINEVYIHGSAKLDTCDWVELYNAGSESVNLSDYALSDRAGKPEKLPLSDTVLASGEYAVINLGDDSFSLGEEESLYLSCGGVIVDAVSLRFVPTGGSIGRERGNGWYYYSASSPGEENRNGCRSVAGAPVLSGQDGVFSPGESVTVELTGEGSIYYTTDCTRPGTESTLYRGPITLSETTVLRAVSVADGKLNSEVSTYSFIFTDVSLPVVSLVGDVPSTLNSLKHAVNKTTEVSCILSFYEDSGSFTIPCGVHLGGNTSLKQHSKSFKVHFRGCYGADTLSYDVFGTGITEYHSLGLRRGYDSLQTVFKSELFETLARSFTDVCPIQNSRFCRMYINGEYWGLVSLREDFSTAYFSAHDGSDESSVEYCHFPVDTHSVFYSEVTSFCSQSENTGEAAYSYLSSVLDIDSVIDWMVVKGIAGDIDHCNNVACYRSSATAYKWRFLIWDFDGAGKVPFRNMVSVSTPNFYSQDMSLILRTLLSSKVFRSRLIERVADALNGSFSEENFLSVLSEYENLLREEVTIDFKEWNTALYVWEARVAYLRKTVCNTEWRDQTVHNLVILPGMEGMDFSALTTLK